MEQDKVMVLANAYEMLRGAKFDGLSGEQTVIMGQTVIAFRDIVQELLNENQPADVADEEVEDATT